MMTINDSSMENYNGISNEDTASFDGGEDGGHLPVVSLQVRDRTQDAVAEDDEFFPLSSSKYRYCKWHELDDVDVKGNMLRSPRIRKAPKGYKLETLRKIELEEGMGDSDEEEDRRMLHVPKLRKNKPKRTNNYRNKVENWENAESVNLSFQDLGHPFQKKEFLRVLRRLIRCEQIQLIEDSLTDLSSVALPRCKKLFLQRNFISDLKKLPKTPMLEHLSLQQNTIESLNGLEVLLKSQIKSLILKGNPVELLPNYRQQVFRILPDLKVLDGTPKLESDVDNSLTEMVTKTCIVS